MRSDKQKATASKKAGGKQGKKDLESRRQPQAAAKQGHPPKDNGQGFIRRQDEKSGHTLH